ncbi:hypothetical protein [Robbsia sp. KACC 23696]|uniref:hypothetical protein n=1 Tax=Robbsia sp. KACC 23696 TaxID=3149231 RepID=UPI00325B35D2
MDHLFATAAWISVAARLMIGLACLLPWARPRPAVGTAATRRPRQGRRDSALLFSNLWMVTAFASWAADAVIQS